MIIPSQLQPSRKRHVQPKKGAHNGETRKVRERKRKRTTPRRLPAAALHQHGHERDASLRRELQLLRGGPPRELRRRAPSGGGRRQSFRRGGSAQRTSLQFGLSLYFWLKKATTTAAFVCARAQHDAEGLHRAA
eukprot:SAG11_NODE_252_length_11593_cov_7.436663_1_plen_133_part_10